jgi:hypothetical protein
MSAVTALKWAARLFCAITFFSCMAVIGFAIFGPAHDDFWHTVMPGNVAVRMGRHGGISYVKPWVAIWYDRAMWIGLASAFLAACASGLANKLVIDAEPSHIR